MQKFFLYFHPARSKEIMTNREIGSHLVLFPSLLWRAKKIYASQRRLLEETRRRKISRDSVQNYLRSVRVG